MYFVAITHSKHLLRIGEFSIEVCSGREVHYTKVGNTRQSDGVRAAQRQEVLPSAQRAPGREGDADSPSTPWGTRADHRASGARSFQEAPVRGAQLACPAGASERSASRSRGFGFPGGAEAGGGVAGFELRTGGPFSADSPSF